MAIAMDGLTSLYDQSPRFSLAIAPFLVVAIIFTVVRVYTTIRYKIALQQFSSVPGKFTPATPPPAVPYTVPILGHAIAFLAPRPGEFWSKFFRSHPRSTGAATLKLGGNTTHILFSPSAVQGLFKARGPTRHSFDVQVTTKGFGNDKTEAMKYFGFGEGPDDTGITPLQQQENINHRYVLETKAVNALTAEFTKVLAKQLKMDCGTGKDNEDRKEVDLFAWLQDRMFTASTTAFMGSRILEIYPTLRKDFFDFDRYMLTMFFGIPRLFSLTAYKVRANVLAGLSQWHNQMLKECDGSPADPAGDLDWEPVYGSRANRARQRYYASRGLAIKTRAGMDLGFLFGLSSNAIPATGWMLMHILNPQGDKSLFGRVMQEVQSAVRDDGTLDIPTLATLPLLHSIFHEVLRLYVDVLVTRECKEDLTLPLDDGQRSIVIGKDSLVMAPSWLGHRDENLWNNPPSNQFHAERFLKSDPKTGKMIFSTSGTNGKLFPWGGGKTICPGRVFAKQEVLASVAMVLSTFDLEVLRFVDEKGKTRDEFPGLRQSYSGSGIMAMEGDMRIILRSRKR